MKILFSFPFCPFLFRASGKSEPVQKGGISFGGCSCRRCGGVERVEEMILFVGEQEVQLLLLEQDEKDCTVLQLSTEQGKVC